MKFRKIAYKDEPFLHVHKYIVLVHSFHRNGPMKTKHHYCLNLQEVRAVKNKVKVGSVVEVHKAVHNFHQAWERMK